MKVKITTDSTCDLSQELLNQYNIAVIPLTVTLGERFGQDGVDIMPSDIYSYVEQSGNLPKTSAVSILEYTEFFQIWHDQGFEVIHFCISSHFSSSYQNACIAAREIGNVWIMDSENLSTGQGLAVLHSAELAMAGYTANEIVEQCNAIIPRIEASFVANSIDYLRKGGRCSALAALGANVLQIKPCIEVVAGYMKPRKKYRGGIKKVIRLYAEDQLKDRRDIDTHRIFITHTRCDAETIEYVKSLIRKLQPEIVEILETTAGATITTHCGPETLGVLFVRKP